MNTAALRDEICRVGASLHARGYVHGSAGNISVRLPAEEGGGFLITPTDASLGHLDAARLAHVADDGTQRGGDPASKTLALHRRIYATAPAVRCVLHTHSTHLVALTLRGVWSPEDVLPPITPYQVMKVGHVPLIPYAVPGAPDVAEAIAAQIVAHAARGHRLHAVLCDRLGPQVWHDSPAAAMATLEELEETARLWLMNGCSTTPLTREQIDALCTRFGVSW